MPNNIQWSGPRAPLPLEVFAKGIALPWWGLVLHQIWFPDEFRVERPVQAHLLQPPQPSREADSPGLEELWEA